MGLGTKNRQKQTADLCKQYLRQRYPDKLGLVEEFIVEIEGPAKNCDVACWSQFTDIKDIKKEMFQRLELKFENWLNSWNLTMATKWPESVRNSGKLLIWAAATAGWSVALERAIKEFNRAAHAGRLALRFELTTKESDAQVTFGVGKPEEFQSSTHGKTSLSSIEHSGEIIKADILVHPKPQVWASQDTSDRNFVPKRDLTR
jgi:hypothetical protein